MKDEILERMRAYMVEHVSKDEVLSDINHKKEFSMSDISDPTKFKQFMEDVESWSKESQRGLVCGIFGCTESVAFVCPYCKCSYCDRDKKLHFHSVDNDGLITDAELNNRNEKNSMVKDQRQDGK